MLNDIRRPAAYYSLAQGISLGVALGWFAIPLLGGVELTGTVLTVGLVLTVVGLAAELVSGVVWVWWVWRQDRLLVDTLDRGSSEIVAGTVDATPAPGRVRRVRLARGHRGGFLRGAGRVPGRALLVVAEVLADDGPRRVGVLAPAPPNLWRRRTPLALLLHPHEREVAVLDDRVGAEQLAQVAADPRWRSAALPSDARVAGWALMLAATGAGLLVGVAINAGVIASVA